MNNRRKIQGSVVGNKADKTIIVQVESYKKHPKYKKRVQSRSKYYAHDEENKANVGDIVTIEECRPISKTKKFKLISIDQKALESIKVLEETEVEKVLHEDVEENPEEKEAK